MSSKTQKHKQTYELSSKVKWHTVAFLQEDLVVAAALPNRWWWFTFVPGKKSVGAALRQLLSINTEPQLTGEKLSPRFCFANSVAGLFRPILRWDRPDEEVTQPEGHQPTSWEGFRWVPPERGWQRGRMGG